MTTETLNDVERWPHQIRATSDVKAAIEEGHRRICLTCPTGGGKSLIACDLIDDWTADMLKTVLYTNRKMLIEQLSSVLTGHGIGHGVRAADWEQDHSKWVQVSSIQTEHSRVHKQMRWDLHDADRVIIDEAHLNSGEVCKRIADAHVEKGATIIGLTATPLDLGHFYDHLIQAGTNSELRKCGSLVHAIHKGIDEPDMRKFKPSAKTGEFTENQVRKAIMTPCIFGRVLDHYRLFNPEEKPAILFAPGVKESQWFAEQLSNAGIRSAHIDGGNCWLDGETYRSDREARNDMLAGSKDGTIKVICNRFVLREGLDLKWIEYGIFATVMGSLQTFLQSAGRLLRSNPGKTHATIQDHGGMWWRHGSVNEDRHWELGTTENIVQGMRAERLRAKKEKEPIRCPNCMTILKDGPKCKICGHEVTKRSRPVIQLDGRLVEHTGDIFKPRVPRMKPDTVELWTRMYWRSVKKQRTFRAAEALFFHENRYWPPRDLPLMPQHDIDWFRRADEVPKERLS